jgi:signal transduction histidine kinase/ligand-binding sensor domain-containing protein
MLLRLRKSEPVNQRAGFSFLSAGRLTAAFFCAGIGFVVPSPLNAQPAASGFSFRAWTQQNGLPTNEVTGLSRSRSGYLLVGTPNGVVRFDGRQFSAMTHTAETAIHDRGISAFASIPGSDELLAAPRLGGLLRLSGDDFSPYALPERFAQTPIEALFFENDITLWIGFRGGFALRKQAGRLEVFDASAGLNEHEPIQFARDSRGGVWLASGSFLARYESGQLVPASVLGARQKEHVRIASSRTDGPWVIIGEEVFKLADGKLKTIAQLGKTTGAYYIQALLEDAGGELWIGTRSAGLHRLAADNQLRHIAEAPEDISALLEDVAGNLWVGTANSGILRVKAAVLDVFDRSAGLLERRSLSLCRDNDGVLWFANRDGGIVFRDASARFSVFEPTRAWEDFSAYSVSPAKGGGIWAATTHGLLRINDGKIQAQFTQDFLTRRATPRVTLTAKNGDLWLALEAGGICRFRDGGFVRFDLKRGAEASLVRTLSEGPDGAIWAGCDDGSLHRLENGETFSSVELRAFAGKVGAIQAIGFGEAEATWIGTQKGGLLRLNAQGVSGVSTQQGLVSENITQIVADDRGALWLGSTGAIFHVGIDELEKFFRGETRRIYPVTVGPDEGLNEATCSADYQPAVTKTEDGRLWFATRQGVVAIDPEKETSAPERPRVKITGVWLDEHPLAASPVTRLAPNPRALELRYSAPNLSVPERVRMRHRLTGYDDDWQESEREGAAKYTRLPPGRYRFEVAALLAGVPGAESADSITVEVQAAWWQTIWFRLFTAALVIGVVVIVVRHVSHRRLIEKLARLERERALERERTRIAENIHDDLGAGLTRISLLTQSGHDKAKSQLDRIYDIVGDLIQSMDEIVWAVNPSNDDLESVANYLAEYAQSYCSDAGLRCRVKIPKSLPHHALTTQFRHHLFLSCKEALNNVVKHAHASDVSVEVLTADDALMITIADNGTGLPDGIEATSHRNGLKNMHSRMRMLGGDATFARATPQGTVVTLAARLSQSASTP